MIRLCLAIGALACVVQLNLSSVSAQWVESPLSGWTKVQVEHQSTRHQFSSRGTITEYEGEDARSVTTTLRMTSAIGVFDGVDVWIDIPYHRLVFDDASGRWLSHGVGDPRVYVRAAPSLFDAQSASWPVQVAVRGGVKLPFSEAEPGSDVIPLSEGQRDWEMLLELGRSFYPAPVYAVGWFGYRWREANTKEKRKPGDQWMALVAVGGEVRSFTWKLSVDGIWGQPPVRTEFDLSIPSSRRRYVQLIPELGYRLGPGVLEAGVRIPVAATNLPAGPTVTVGYFLTWD